MSNSSFHAEPYDAGTLTKLKIFELYVQEWIPVFVSQPEPRYRELHIYDLFCGPGTDSIGVPGSPLRVLEQLRQYQRSGRMAGWSKTNIVVHLSDEDARKVSVLGATLTAAEWRIPGVTIDLQPVSFRQALGNHRSTLANPNAAKLLIIDQFGVDEVREDVFRTLIAFPTTDFMFFLSSSTLHRFRDHPSIKIKIPKPEDSYDVHRAAFDWYRQLAPRDVFLGRFSIRKRSNIYGLIFGSHHPLGIVKFLHVAWSNDEIRGEANFDIDRENITPGELMLPLRELRPSKVQEFEAELERRICDGRCRSEADLIRSAIEAGMTAQHCAPVLKSLKAAGLIHCEFGTPQVSNFYKPRLVSLANR